jgi:hypothetical protein
MIQKSQNKTPELTYANKLFYVMLNNLTSNINLTTIQKKKRVI